MGTGRHSSEEVQFCPGPGPGAAAGDIPPGEMTPRVRARWLPSALLLLQLPGELLSPSWGRGGGRTGAGSAWWEGGGGARSRGLGKGSRRGCHLSQQLAARFRARSR